MKQAVLPKIVQYPWNTASLLDDAGGATDNVGVGIEVPADAVPIVVAV